MKPNIYHRSYQCGENTLTLGQRTLIMGILNVTPDSFSDGGQYVNREAAVQHALQMVADGADIIDIGGESTRPGHEPVSQEDELNRVLPVIQAIHQAAPHIVISIDTYKAEVARQALVAGAHILNDVWGAKADPQMAAVAAEFGCPIILMHNRKDRNYDNYIEDIVKDLQTSIEIALHAGVSKDHIILDPGVGFAKDHDENLRVMRSLDRLTTLGYPVLLATSRKRFIQTTLGRPADDVVEGTAATAALGIAQGCQIIRVHDITALKRTITMCDAVIYSADHPTEQN